MKYEKPEITLVGSASEVIRQHPPKSGVVSDGFEDITAPAYEADE
jgi:hypothetical protein